MIAPTSLERLKEFADNKIAPSVSDLNAFVRKERDRMEKVIRDALEAIAREEWAEKMRQQQEMAANEPEESNDPETEEIEGPEPEPVIEEPEPEEPEPEEPKTKLIMPPNIKLIKSSIFDLGWEIEAESVDWIVTDPPYPKEYLDTWTQLVEFASHALKPGGHLLALSGQSYLFEVMSNLQNENLTYVWTLAYMMKDHIGLRHRPIAGCGWKPLFWYCKGGIPEDPNINDVIYSDPAGSGEYHKWGQSSDGFVQIFDRFKPKPNDLIVDPFLGGGTTAIACLEYGGLRFIGADIDETCITTTEDRILKYLEESGV